MTDALLARITAPAPETVRAKFVTPAWTPEQASPTVVFPGHPNTNDPLPEVDVVVSTYTYAEGQACADVMTPGLSLDQWTRITRDFDSYLPDLTDRSPARDSRCLGQFAHGGIGGKRVLFLRNELHVATDSTALPIRRFWGQVATETGCSLWLDTGTSGGVGPNVLEGDTVAARNVVFDCTGFLKYETWAHQSFPTTFDLSTFDFSLAETLMLANADLLPPGQPRAPKVWTGSDLATCDSFLFDAVGDPYGLEKYDGGDLLCEEMDCAVLGLVAQDLGAAMPKYASLRSISDPQMPALPGGVPAEKRAASEEYDEYGYAAQVATLCAVWAVIVSL